MRILFCSSYTIRLFSKICWTKYVFPLCVGPTTKSGNLWRKLNSGHGLVTMDAVTFRAAFFGCRTEQVFLRTLLLHVINDVASKIRDQYDDILQALLMEGHDELKLNRKPLKKFYLFSKRNWAMPTWITGMDESAEKRSHPQKDHGDPR